MIRKRKNQTVIEASRIQQDGPSSARASQNGYAPLTAKRHVNLAIRSIGIAQHYSWFIHYPCPDTGPDLPFFAGSQKVFVPDQMLPDRGCSHGHSADFVPVHARCG